MLSLNRPPQAEPASRLLSPVLNPHDSRAKPRLTYFEGTAVYVSGDSPGSGAVAATLDGNSVQIAPTINDNGCADIVYSNTELSPGNHTLNFIYSIPATLRPLTILNVT